MINAPTKNGYYWLKTYYVNSVTKERVLSGIEIVSVFFNTPYRNKTRNLVAGRFWQETLEKLRDDCEWSDEILMPENFKK